MTREGRQQLFSKGDRTFHRIANNCFSTENKKRHSNNCDFMALVRTKTKLLPRLPVCQNCSERSTGAAGGGWSCVRAGQQRVGMQLLHKGQNQKSAKNHRFSIFGFFSWVFPARPGAKSLMPLVKRKDKNHCCAQNPMSPSHFGDILILVDEKYIRDF